DFNDDLRRYPFDEEFKAISQHFGVLLKKIVESVDKYGLKTRHLQKHHLDIERFARFVRSGEFVSEIAQGYQKRLEKYEGKLFTFLDHDGVPWNNNNAEH